MIRHACWFMKQGIYRLYLPGLTFLSFNRTLQIAKEGFRLGWGHYGNQVVFDFWITL